jgi:hypothetical protein
MLPDAGVIALEAQVTPEGTVPRVTDRGVLRNCFVVHGPGLGLAQKGYPFTLGGYYYDILVVMAFPLPAVVQGLFLLAFGALAAAFDPIHDQVLRLLLRPAPLSDAVARAFGHHT